MVNADIQPILMEHLKHLEHKYHFWFLFNWLSFTQFLQDGLDP